MGSFFLLYRKYVSYSVHSERCVQVDVDLIIFYLEKMNKKRKKIHAKLYKMWYNERVKEGFVFVNKEGFL